MTKPNITTHWKVLIRSLATNPKPSRLISSGIKYFQNEGMIIPGADWSRGFDVPLEMLGYGAKSSKMTQLRRHYYNEGSVEAAKSKLKERIGKKADYSSVAVSMKGEDKDGRSQGHCISTVVVTYNPQRFPGKQSELTVDIFYRVTEVVKKFGADLKFLHEIVIPSILPEELSVEDIDEVRFHFANIYFSPLFLPLLVPQMNVLDLMEEIYATQPFEALRGCYNSLANLTKDPDRFSYRSRRQMVSFLHNTVQEDRFKYINLLNKLHELNPRLKEIEE